MAKVTTGACMSLDGFIAGPNESGFDRLFAWHHDGDVEVPFTFVTDGIESAVEHAKALAGDRNVAVNGGSMASQALEAGLIDEIHIDLAPVVLGGGVPFLDRLKNVPVDLEGPTVVEGRGVTHLRYRVRYPDSRGDR